MAHVMVDRVNHELMVDYAQSWLMVGNGSMVSSCFVDGQVKIAQPADRSHHWLPCTTMQVDQQTHWQPGDFPANCERSPECNVMSQIPLLNYCFVSSWLQLDGDSWLVYGG